MGSVDTLLEKPGVKLLSDEVGSVKIDHESRRTSVLELSDGSVYGTASVETTLGTLVHSEFDDGDQQESHLVLDDSPNHPYRKERNRSVKRSAENRRKLWPQNTEAALVVRDGSLRFIRDATRNELVALGKVVGKQHSEIEAIVDGDEADYRVFSTPSEEDASKSAVYGVDLETETVLSDGSSTRKTTVPARLSSTITGTSVYITPGPASGHSHFRRDASRVVSSVKQVKSPDGRDTPRVLSV